MMRTPLSVIDRTTRRKDCLRWQCSFLVCITVWLFAASAGEVVAQTHDLQQEFSTAQNPNGLWSYGSLDNSFDAPFVLNLDPRLDQWNNANIFDWFLPTHVTKNSSDQEQQGLAARWLPFEVVLVPEFNVADGTSRFAVVRFSVPATGLYSVVGFFGARKNTVPQMDADAFILHDQAPVFSTSPSLFRDDKPFSLSLMLTEGDTLDFVATNGGPPQTTDAVAVQAVIELLNDDALDCQDAIGKAARLYLTRTSRAILRCLNKFNAGRALFLDETKTVQLTAASQCRDEFKTAASIQTAGEKARFKVAAPGRERCVDATVSSLGICDVTVDGLIDPTGQSGCLIGETDGAVNTVVEAAYGVNLSNP